MSLPVKFQARAGNVYVGLRPGGIDLAFGGFGSERAALALDFVHADQNAPITASEQKEGVTNYLLGPDSSRWYSHIPNFGRVTYSDLYPGVSLAFYGNGHHLEYDFVVAPGGDYHQVRMRVNGANSISIAADGSSRSFVRAAI